MGWFTRWTNRKHDETRWNTTDMMDINSWMFHLLQVNEAPAGSIVACAISSMEGSELGNLVAYREIYLERLRFRYSEIKVYLYRYIFLTWSVCVWLVGWETLLFAQITLRSVVNVGRRERCFSCKKDKLLVLLEWITCMLTTLYYVRVRLKHLEPYKWMMFKKTILTKHDQIGDPFWHLSDWFAIAWVVIFSIPY